jgi:hypothetical protein
MSGPFKYQRELVEKYESANKEAYKLILKGVKENSITGYGRINGPYMSYVTYYSSDGTSMTVSEPASLHWVTQLIWEY